MRNKESDYIIILCGRFIDPYKPLTRSEFWKKYHSFGNSVEKMVSSEDERIVEFLKRSGSISFELEELRQMGIHITTFLDEDFPEQMFDKLGDFCPPLLYFCGEGFLMQGKFAGYVGSRVVEEADIR